MNRNISSPASSDQGGRPGQPEARSTSEDQQDKIPKPSTGLSQFIARILEQLSITAWLPATMLVGVGSLLVQLHQRNYMDIPDAVHSLATQPWGIIIIMIFALVLVTMVTQAFSFQAIRFLEGYWSSGFPFDRLLACGVRMQLKRRNKLRKKSKKVEQQAFESARPGLLQGKDREYIGVWEDSVYEVPRKNRPERNKALIAAATDADWRPRADPGSVAVFDRCKSRLDNFPANNHRLLPTRLGNTLRSSEDSLGLEGRVLEGFVMENYAKIPARLMVQHDQFRDRLDMYSNLVFVFFLLAFASVPLLYGSVAEAAWMASIGGLLTFILLAYLSYRAAISSAEAYGTILVTISRCIR